MNRFFIIRYLRLLSKRNLIITEAVGCTFKGCDMNLPFCWCEGSMPIWAQARYLFASAYPVQLCLMIVKPMLQFGCLEATFGSICLSSSFVT